MASHDSSLNFDWLKKEVDSEIVNPGSGNDSSTILKDAETDEDKPAEESPPEDSPSAEDNESALSDLSDIPSPVLNESDGTTVVIPQREEPAPGFESPESPPAPAETTAETGGENPSEADQKEVDGDFENVAASLPDPTAETVDNTPHEPSSPAANEEAVESDSAGRTTDWSPPAERFSFPPAPRERDSEDSHDTVLEEPTPAVDDPEEGNRTDVIRGPIEPERSPIWESPSAAAGGGFVPSEPAGELDPSSPDSARPDKAPTDNGVSAPAIPGWGFILLASYASAITLALLLLLLTSGDNHHLESLPDIPPEKVDTLSYVPPDANLPEGHTLHLGEKRRFGNILVEPLRITREPIEFQYYSGDDSVTRAPSEPVWKLWVRLTNVSEEQEISPLGRHLVLRWITKNDARHDFSNYYITAAGTDDPNAPLVQLYRLPVTSDWDMKGQDLGKVLKPGESMETYLASDSAGLNELGDSLVWRLQLRKGYSPQGHGVTTEVEVAFKKSDVVAAKS